MIDDDWNRIESEPHRRLVAAIEDLSEEHWMAGWLTGVEWALLDMLDGRIGFVWAGSEVTAAELENLRSIRDELRGGWVAWEPMVGVVPVALADIDKARAAWEFAP